MKAKDLKGIIPPIMTAFAKDGQVYEKGTREIIEFLVPHVQGLYPCGSYGSGPMMSIEERKKVAEIMVDQVRGRVAIIVHVGTADTRTTVELARHAESIGAQGVGAVTPYYNKHGEEAIFTHFQQLIRAVSIPVFLYNNPVLSGNPVPLGLLPRLAKEGLAGIKDSTFSMENYYHSQMALKDFPEMNLIIGTEALLVAAFDAGAQAAVTGLGNVYPELVQKLYRDYLGGDREGVMKTQEEVLRVRQITKYGPTVPTCHAILKLRGVDSGYPRSPLLPVSVETVKRVEEALRAMGQL